MRHETYTYRWHCGEGSVDLYCTIELDLAMDPETFKVMTINACYCSMVSQQTKEAVFHFHLWNYSEYLAHMGQQFLIQHAANRFNVADDLQAKLRKKFNVPAAA